MDSAGKRARGVPARQSPGPWCLPLPVVVTRKTKSLRDPRPILFGAVPPIILKIRALCSWVREPQKRHRKRDNTVPAGHARPASLPLGSGSPSPSPSPPKAARHNTTPVLPPLVTCGPRPRFGQVWMRCRCMPQPQPPAGFSPVATIKGGQAEGGRKEAAARPGKAILLAKAEAGSGSGSAKCMHV